MSDIIKHECGIALIRLLKPLEYYLGKYGTPFYGLNKLHLLMQKQHNRGQDGAGLAVIKLNLKPGLKYINRIRSKSAYPITDIFNKVNEKLNETILNNTTRLNDVLWLKNNFDYSGELYLGHLRYGTFGLNKTSNLHPVARKNNWMTRNLVLAGNFNMTNVDQLFSKLIELGQYPVETSDTITILEKIGHFLDEENDRIYQKYKSTHTKQEISTLIARELDLQDVLRKSSQNWDGGYVIAGLVGHGDAFVVRVPSGIRQAYFYHDEEVAVVTSERPAIQTAFNAKFDQVKEIKPGHAIIIKNTGEISEKEFTKPREKMACSFERIYFSRGTDKDIYRERKKLGRSIVPAIMREIDHDLENTVFSYIPNTASVAFRGLLEGLVDKCSQIKLDKILSLDEKYNPTQLEKILSLKPRIEEVAVKDIKLRTFITQDTKRDDLVAHVYDITYGSIRPGKDNLVVIDDSIVRGTTLKNSIIRILDRLEPKKIVIASSAPQIRYPDCYGIDMAKLGDFIAFRAAIELLKEKNMGSIINKVYKDAIEQNKRPKEQVENVVKNIYKPLTAEQISARISKMLKSKDIKAEISVIYQSIEDLHASCPENKGDWYFTGNYPTPGGNVVANKSFINFVEGKNERAYGL